MTDDDTTDAGPSALELWTRLRAIARVYEQATGWAPIDHIDHTRGWTDMNADARSSYVCFADGHAASGYVAAIEYMLKMCEAAGVRGAGPVRRSSPRT
jgi:prepilin-type processing-associated H-X9-DG protein